MDLGLERAKPRSEPPALEPERQPGHDEPRGERGQHHGRDGGLGEGPGQETDRGRPGVLEGEDHHARGQQGDDDVPDRHGS